MLPEAEEALHRALVASRIELSVPNVGGTVDWSPKGVFVTEGPEESGVIDIRDASTGESLRSFEGHGIDVNDVAFSPDGSMLATTGDDGKLKLWDPATGRLLRAWSGEGAVWGPAFSADGERVAAAWQDEGVLRIVETTHRRVISTIRMDGAFDAAFSPDASRIAVSSRFVPDASVFNVETGRLAFGLTGHSSSLRSIAWSPDGRYIATASDDGSARVWEGRMGQSRFTLTGHSDVVWSVDWGADSRRLVTSGNDGVAIVWEITEDDDRELLRLSAQGSGVFAAFSPSGDRVITGSSDISVAKIWNLGRSGDAEWANLPIEEQWPGDVAFMPEGRRVVANSATDAVAIWDPATGRKVGPDDQPEGNEFIRFDLSPDGKLIATAGFDGTARVWDAATGEPRFEVAHDEQVVAVAWSEGGGHLVTGSSEGTVKIVDKSGRQVQALRVAKGFSLTDAALSPDGNFVVTSAFPPRSRPGGRVQIWERDSGDVVTTIKAEALEVLFDPTGERLATSDQFGLAQMWDVGSGKSLTRFSGHSGPVLDVAFNPDGTRVATAGNDGTVRLFDAGSGVELLVLRGHEQAVYGVDFSPDGTRLVSAGEDGVARIWALDMDDLLELAQDEVTRSLTGDECRQYLHLDRCPA